MSHCGLAEQVDRLGKRNRSPPRGEKMVVIESNLSCQSPVPNKEETEDCKDDGKDGDDDESSGPAGDEMRRFMGAGGR